MINPTTLTLMLALVVVGVLGGWLLLGLLLRNRRDSTVETLVLEHDRKYEPGVAEHLLLEEIRRLRAATRERQILVGCCAVLILLTVIVGYTVIDLTIVLGGL